MWKLILDFNHISGINRAYDSQQKKYCCLGYYDLLEAVKADPCVSYGGFILFSLYDIGIMDLLSYS